MLSLISPGEIQINKDNGFVYSLEYQRRVIQAGRNKHVGGAGDDMLFQIHAVFAEGLILSHHAGPGNW
jgi:hypothetical protein